MHDFHVRMYDPQIGRTWQPDPMAERRVWTAPYSWVQNNPIGRIDPTGAVNDEFDKAGNKISDLGGNKIDFFHQENGDTKIVDRETRASNIITNGEKYIKGYTHRDKNTSWNTLSKEYFNGVGPVKSLISDFDNTEKGIFGSIANPYSVFTSKIRKEFLNTNDSKGLVKYDYGEVNPGSAGLDGWAQFLGRTNISYYKIGNKVLFFLTDSKSATSFSYRLSPSWERQEYRQYGNTYQTYIWTESILNVIHKNSIYINNIQKDPDNSVYQRLPALKD